jgi:uncharacterized protein (DUF697 family)
MATKSSVLTRALTELVSQIPQSEEPLSDDPKERALAIARRTAMQAATVSGALALPPGPMGFATILPDLMSIWKLQQSMVADIASVYGKSSYLKKEAMVYCLFKHGGAALLRDMVTRVGERYIVRRLAVSTLQEILTRLGVRLSQRVLTKSISRLIPVIGALGVGGYAYYDTTRVAATAIELFSRKLELEPVG